MDRYWFFTWRTYGTWLPGEVGFVGDYISFDGRRVSDNAVGEPTAPPMPALARYAAGNLVQPSVSLSREQACAVRDQLAETARYRGRQLDAVAILVNHVHIVFGTPGDPAPDAMMDDFKAYASRALNRLQGWRPPAPRPIWWARDGSKRVVKSDGRRAGAIRYVRDQDHPLLVWLNEECGWLLAQYPEDVWTSDEQRGEPRP